MELGLLERDGDVIRLTPRGRLLSNEVFERFILVWGGHLSAAFEVDLLWFRDAITEVCRKVNNKIKGGGQQCPPHINAAFRR